MAASVDWSSLPSDLVNRIADCLLATNDVDYYTDLRAVCSSWRSAAADAMNNPDPCFHPMQWIVIDEVSHSLDVKRGTRLLVNKTTGRFLRKDLPMLRRYYVITTGPDGFFVLADREPPHAVCILNPFTGYLLRFMTPMVDFAVDSAAIHGWEEGPLLLILFCDSCRKLYIAHTDSECFYLLEEDKVAYTVFRLSIMVMTYNGHVSTKIRDLLGLFGFHPSELMSVYPSETGHASRCFIVESAGKIQVIIKLQHSMEVFRWNTDRDGVFEPIKSIGNQAIFLGHRKCLSVNAAIFPSIDANCIYYLKSLDPYDIYMYDLKDGKEERVSGAITAVNCDFLSDAEPPFTIIQLLSSFTTNAWDSERKGHPDADDYGLSSLFEELEFGD
uniref:Uncharacterized protein n=1 Tax=Avena sativa TaxID=4498 RepID=A0ACD5XKU6_AVESA